MSVKPHEELTLQERLSQIIRGYIVYSRDNNMSIEEYLDEDPDMKTIRDELENNKDHDVLDFDKRIEEINVFNSTRKLGARMKEYENLSRFKLDKKYPLIIRLDGNAFHTFTKGFNKPFDELLRESMERTAVKLLELIPGSQMAYHQSDEISILITNYQLSNREPWFDNNISKLTSITASMATLEFNRIMNDLYFEMKSDRDRVDLLTDAHMTSIQKGALFDSRAFVLPKEEVTNYFIWRQEDAIKNAISMVAQSMFSHNSLQGQNGVTMVERIEEKMMRPYDKLYTAGERRGTVAHRLAPLPETKEIRMKDGSTKIVEFERSKWGTDQDIPVFKEDRGYIEKFL